MSGFYQEMFWITVKRMHEFAPKHGTFLHSLKDPKKKKVLSSLIVYFIRVNLKHHLNGSQADLLQIQCVAALWWAAQSHNERFWVRLWLRPVGVVFVFSLCACVGFSPHGRFFP